MVLWGPHKRHGSCPCFQFVSSISWMKPLRLKDFLLFGAAKLQIWTKSPQSNLFPRPEFLNSGINSDWAGSGQNSRLRISACFGTRISRKIHEIERATKWPRKLQRPSPPASCKASMFVATLGWWNLSLSLFCSFIFSFYLSLSFLLPFFFFTFLSYFLHFPSLFFTFPFLFSVPFPLPVLVLSSFHFLSSSSSFPLFLPFSLFFPLPFLLLWWVDEVCEETAGKDIAHARQNLSHGTAGFRLSPRKVRERRGCFNMSSANATIVAS